MNQPIRRVALFCFLLIVSLLVSSNYIQVVNADSYKARDRNQRIILDQYAHPRGTITTADGVVVAQSVPSGGLNFKYMRRYPQATAYANVVGFKSFYSADDVELQLDQFLNGNGGDLAAGDFMDVVDGKGKQGGNVQLTIENKVQQVAVDALGKRTGSVVALDPTTGAILAMYSNPTYDPNAKSSNDVNTAAAAAKALAADKTKPNQNHATSEIYPPGSIFKIITAAAALDAGGGRFTATDPTPTPPDQLTFPGGFSIPNQDGTCPDTTLKTALAKSCNTVFGSLGDQIGAQNMYDTAHKFGLDTPGFGLPAGGGTKAMPVATSTFPKLAQPDAPQLALASIGQGATAVSPLQAAMIAAAVADDGKLMTPYLVAKQTSARGATVYAARPTELDEAMTPDTAKAIGDMMVNVVQNGTGVNGQIPGVTVGGKTGTAQRGTGQNPLAWFISYASIPNGRAVAVAVLVQDDNAKRADISGGGLAAPVAQKVMKAALGVP